MLIVFVLLFCSAAFLRGSGRVDQLGDSQPSLWNGENINSQPFLPYFLSFSCRCTSIITHRKLYTCDKVPCISAWALVHVHSIILHVYIIPCISAWELYHANCVAALDLGVQSWCTVCMVWWNSLHTCIILCSLKMITDGVGGHFLADRILWLHCSQGEHSVHTCTCTCMYTCRHVKTLVICPLANKIFAYYFFTLSVLCYVKTVQLF